MLKHKCRRQTRVGKGVCVVYFRRMATMKEIERLFKANYAVMLRLASAIVHDPDAAGDVVHGVFESLLVSGSAAPVDTPYLLRSVRNRALNHLRDLDVRQRVAGLYALDAETDGAGPDVDMPDYGKLAELIAERLTPQTARVVRLRFYQGRKYAEIADALGISEAAVYKHLRQAVETLRSFETLRLLMSD